MVSARQGCRAIPISRHVYYYRSRRDAQTALRQRIREIAESRRRFGCKRIHVMLIREGWKVNHKRVYRLYKEEGLGLRLKWPKRKRGAYVRGALPIPSGPNEQWSMDFV